MDLFTQCRNNAAVLAQLVDQTHFLDQLYKKVPLRQRVWHATHDVMCLKTCKMCNRAVKWTEKTSEYRTYCSPRCAHSDPEVKEKTKQTCLDRYGQTSNLKTAQTQEKIKQTCLSRYGTARAASSEKVKNKIRAVFEEKYGGNPAALPAIKEKISQTHLSRYGRKRQSQSHIPQGIIDLKNNQQLMLHWFKDLKMPVSEIAERLNVNHSQLCVHFKENLGIDISRHTVSADERQLREFVLSLDVPAEWSNRQLIKPKEVDFYFPQHRVAIELDGLAWHCQGRGKPVYAHKEKSDLCAAAGVHLVHVTDYEWHNKRAIVESRIKAKLGLIKNRIAARKCAVRAVTAADADSFLNQTHIQGSCVSRVRLGLYHNDTLVAVMTWGKSRYSAKAQWELLRYSTQLNCTVVGGASRLFSHFVKHHTPNSVISYSDSRWNTGGLYAQLGFHQVGHSGPNYWYTKKYRTFESRVRYQKHKLELLLDQFDPALTEWENMQANGWDRYWDCGNSIWMWAKLA